MLPTFLIIGAQKSGTTWLASKIEAHPDVFMAPKEIHFFDKEQNYAKGLSWYERHFVAAGSCIAVGEKTPDYLWVGARGAEGHSGSAHQRIKQALPDARLIVVLRNPVKRAISAATHLIRSGRVPPRVTLDDLLFGRLREIGTEHGLLAKGNYLSQIQAYEELFGRDSILVFVLEEDLNKVNENESLARVWTHIGVSEPPPGLAVKTRRNDSRRSRLGLSIDYYVPFSRRLKIGRALDELIRIGDYRASNLTMRALEDHFSDEVSALENHLGRPLSCWRNGEG